MKLATMLTLVAAASLLNASGEQPQFQKAVVAFHASTKGDPYRTPKRITLTGKQLAELERFFPGLGEGKKGFKPAGWNRRVEVRFVKAGAKPLVVQVNTYSNLWTWGRQNGDFRPLPGLGERLSALEVRAK